MIIDGRTIANHILADLIVRVDELQEKYDIQPHLAVIRVGDDPATTSYVNQKAKKAKEIGAVLSTYNFPENVTEQQLRESIAFLQEKPDPANRAGIHGIILQLPFPKSLDFEKLLSDIHPDKDVDGFRENSPFAIPIATAILKLLEIPFVKEQEKLVSTSSFPVIPDLIRDPEIDFPVKGTSVARLRGNDKVVGQSFHEWLLSKKIAVMGKGKTGGQPIIDMLKEQGINVMVIDSTTTHVAEKTQEADIIITAIGKPHILTSDMIQKDAILIGVGMSMDEDGKFVGDYDENDIQDKASWHTPVPGGVGPVNVACLLENLVIAAENSVKN